MTSRGRRSREELKSVPTHDMTPEEYKRSDTPGTYEVITKGAKYVVSGMHSARAIAKTTGGEIRKVKK